jgi:tRNA 2-thiouridine synthesizing protein A
VPAETVDDPGAAGPRAEAAPEPVEEVDARGLSCPMPVIELARAIERIEVGATVALLATDPAARVDVPVWCRMKRHRLLAQTDLADNAWRFLVQRSR